MVPALSLEVRAAVTATYDVVPGPVELGILGLGLLCVVAVVAGAVWLVVRFVKAKNR